MDLLPLFVEVGPWFGLLILLVVWVLKNSPEAFREHFAFWKRRWIDHREHEQDIQMRNADNEVFRIQQDNWEKQQLFSALQSHNRWMQEQFGTLVGRIESQLQSINMQVANNQSDNKRTQAEIAKLRNQLESIANSNTKLTLQLNIVLQQICPEIFKEQE